MVDEKGVRYDTDNRSNLLMSVDSNRKGNETDSTVGNKFALHSPHLVVEELDLAFCYHLQIFLEVE